MNKIFPVITILSLFFLGCASNDPESDQTIVPIQKPTTTTLVGDSSQTGKTLTVPGLDKNITTPPVITKTSVAANPKTTVGMNPPHGQPGHRCDISVGAPLNSKSNPQVSKGATSPVKTLVTSPVKTITPSPVITNAVPVTNAAGVKLNPPHGQPGHDCAIAVGQPLKKNK